MKKALIGILIVFSMFTVGCREIGLNDLLNGSDELKSTNEESQNQDEEVGKEENFNKQDETKDNNDEKQIVSKYNIKDFVGIKANEKYNYAGENSEYAEYVRYVDYIDGDNYQIRINNGGTEAVTVIEATENELKIVFKRGVCYYRENFLNKSPNKDEILLKAPIAKGTKWTLEDGSKRYISSIDTKVSTDAGEFQCIEVTTENKNGQKDLQYYAPGIGLIKEIMDSENMKVTSTLSSIEKNTKLNQVIRFYYPDSNAEYMLYEDISIPFSTNDITRIALQNKFKERSLLKDSVGINSLYLNDDGMLYLDITKNFVAEMANGTAGEYFAIYDLVNTLGSYYGVDKVYMTLDGGIYESGHIVKLKGEYFNLDFSRVQ